MEERKFIDDKHFVQTETFMGEELEAIYLVARKPMDNIEGIGPAKRKILLQTFGTIKRVSEANVKELSEVKGISETDARNIYAYFNGED